MSRIFTFKSCFIVQGSAPRIQYVHLELYRIERNPDCNHQAYISHAEIKLYLRTLTTPTCLYIYIIGWVLIDMYRDIVETFS